MSYLASNNVIVFPSVKREALYYKDSRYLNEQNITRIIKSITDKKSYILSYYPDNDDQNSYTVEFILNGYYFKINNFTNTFFEYNENTDLEIFAEIRIIQNELDNQDSNDLYEGLSIITYIDPSHTEVNGYYHLKLFDLIFNFTNNESDVFVDRDIYELDDGIYHKVETEPADWESSYTNYYILSNIFLKRILENKARFEDSAIEGLHIIDCGTI